MIHPTAIIDKGARLADNVEIGPYCVIGKDVKIGKGTRLVNHVFITGRTEIGEYCTIAPFRVPRQQPQDISYKGEDTACIIRGP